MFYMCSDNERYVYGAVAMAWPLQKFTRQHTVMHKRVLFMK